jgi:hypothetical protein
LNFPMSVVLGLTGESIVKSENAKAMNRKSLAIIFTLVLLGIFLLWKLTPPATLDGPASNSDHPQPKPTGNALPQTKPKAATEIDGLTSSGSGTSRVSASIPASTISSVLLTHGDLHALFVQRETDGTVFGKTLRALILHQCAEALMPNAIAQSTYLNVVRIPADSPYAERREQARQVAVSQNFTRRCQGFTNQVPTEAQIRAAFAVARDAGSDHASLGFLLEAIAAKAKVTRTVDEGAPEFMREAINTTAPNQADASALIKFLAHEDELVRNKAMGLLTRHFTDDQLGVDRSPVHPREFDWAWRLAECERQGNCGPDNPWLLRSCRVDPDDCRHMSVEAALRAQHQAELPGTADISKTDWERALRLRDALLEMGKAGDYSRLSMIGAPPVRGRGWVTISRPASPFNLFRPGA